MTSRGNSAPLQAQEGSSMNRSVAAFRTASLFVVVFFFATMAQAQYRGSLRGTVTDSQGAVVSGATVTLINTETNGTLVSTSDDSGIYNFNALPPAPYKITVEHQGFKKKVLE